MKISILIPCHNEEKSIQKCIESCLGQTRRADEILVVDDGSTDKTPEILKSFGKQIKVIPIPEKTGNKSRAQEIGLRYITGDVFIATDGDTVLDKDFVKRAAWHFRKKGIAAVAGYVKSLKHNWLTACRALDYFVGQTIHKLAQSHIRAIYVIPGCAAAFDTKVFKNYISFDHDTVTEDLDFTYKLNENNLRIKYDPKMIVYTQDPADLRSYINQMRRWYGGGWQNLLKHFRLIKNRPACVFELSLIYLEGLFFSLLIFLLPLININSLGYFFVVLLFTLMVFGLYGAIKEKRLDLLFYAPFYIFVQYLHSLIFLEQFFKVIILRKSNMAWLRSVRREIP